MIPLSSGSYKNLADSGSINSNPGLLTGFYVNSTSSGVINLKNGGSAGTSVAGDITPAIGWHFFPASFTAEPYMSLESGSINITLVFNPTPTS